MTKQELENQLAKRAIKFQVGGFRPDDSLTASWFGKVLVGKKDDTWPLSNGQPMLPICQLNLAAIPNRPDNLKDIAFIAVFVDANQLPNDTPNGVGWELRTYSSLDELHPLEQKQVESHIKPFQLLAETFERDFPKWEDCPVEIPDEFDDDYYDLFPNQDGIKLGGWPTLVQSEIFWAPFNQHPAEPEFAFQIDSVEKANWQWGDNGVAYFGRGTKPDTKEVWAFSWQCL